MSLQTKIEAKLSEALKAKDKKTYSALRLVVAAIKDTMIAKKIKDMGKVMGELNKQYSDVLDFSEGSNIIKENLK